MRDKYESYQPPKSNVESAADLEIPEEIGRKIKHGWVAANIWAAMTFVLTVMMTDSDKSALLDVGIILLLSFGIYKKSRTAAALVFVFCAVSAALTIMGPAGPLRGLLTSLVLLYFFFQAIVGTIQYHKLGRRRRATETDG